MIILILSLLNLAVFVLANWFDRKFYKVRFIDQWTASGSFFNNSSFNEPFNRFVLSRGGILLTIALLLIGVTAGIINSYGTN